MPPTISLPSKPPQKAHHPEPRRALIYFICGNPGLVHYYTVFLECLRGMLDALQDEPGDSSRSSTAYDIYGRNLLGFSDDDHEPFVRGRNEPWDLDGQIEGIYKDVAAQRVPSCHEEPPAQDDAGEQDHQGRPYDFVILMGHSVGAYIALEVFHRHTKTPSLAPHLRLRHGILLFPTLTHIAESPSGRQASLLCKIPRLESNAHLLARFMLGWLPYGVVLWVVRYLMGFTEQTARVTADWAKSRDGVWQAIHLGLSELKTICEEKWEEELWRATAEYEGDGYGDDAGDDAAGKGGHIPKFFIFYGKHDHWVANHMRDAFIERRKGDVEGGHMRVVVDEGDLPHAFCVKEDTSYAVARKVFGWVREIEGL